MIDPNDLEYKETKLILKGKKKLNPIFIELFNWINNKYSVNVINILYDKTEYFKTPRLQVVFKKEKDYKSFNDEGSINGNKKTEKEIILKFKEILKKNRNIEYQTKSIFIFFTCFESVAKIEANTAIKKNEIKKLEKELNNPDLWYIEKSFDTPIFFFYKTEQKLNFIGQKRNDIYKKNILS
jgi:uncharacterized C2H2 Zn-finger protein